jgi:hypothetical protein
VAGMAVAEHEQATTDKPCACLPLPALSRPQLCRCAVPAAYSRPSLPPSRPRAREREGKPRGGGAPRRGEACVRVVHVRGRWALRAPVRERWIARRVAWRVVSALGSEPTMPSASCPVHAARLHPSRVLFVRVSSSSRALSGVY